MSRLSRRQEIIATMIAGVVLLLAVVMGTASHVRAEKAALPGITAMGGNFHIQDAWARINPVAGRPSTAYVTIHHGGKKADALVGVSSPIAARASLHNHLMTGKVMRMMKVADIAIAPDSETILKPGGYHVMLFDVKAPPKPGTKVPLTLTFKSGTKLTLMMVAQAITAGGPAGKSTAGAEMDHSGHH
jgi:periplasmic copper chaperone A